METLKINLLSLAALVLLACIYLASHAWKVTRPPLIKLTNGSQESIEDIVLSGRGFKLSLPSLKPGMSITRQVDVSGESGLSISFSALSRSRNTGDLAYLEPSGGYRTHITIRPDHNVSCDTSF